MRIILTGATGYLGRHLLEELFKSGYEVFALKRKNSNLSLIKKELLSNINFVDIENERNLEEIFTKDIDLVIHTATAYGRKGESKEDIYLANYYFPKKILEYCLKYNIKSFINTDTSLNKNVSEYAKSKKEFVESAKILVEKGKLKFVNLVLEHFYGPGDNETKFISFIINSCMNNVPEINLTKGEQKRDFIYISDVISAYLLIIKYIGDFQRYVEFDVGSGKTITIRNLVEEIHKLCNSKTVLNFGVIPYRSDEVMESQANITPLELLGWSQKIKFHLGIEKIIKEKEVFL